MTTGPYEYGRHSALRGEVPVGMPLSPAEDRVLSLVVQGYANKQVAHTLGTSINTVKWQLYTIYRKMGVGTRVEAALAYTALHHPAPEDADKREYEVVEELAALNHALMTRVHWNRDVPREEKAHARRALYREWARLLITLLADNGGLPHDA
ncbi:MAG: LuxR C-terminal-related transcriptional regulator [Chloroflexi bacterium]|nr:LuxR C-terminal-related transcriptional regulator [Chloroflexota bacterium]